MWGNKMKVTSINNYSQYSKTNFQPKNNKVNFGAIEDDKTRRLMVSMGMDPKDDLYQIPEFTIYAQDGKLKGKVTLPPKSRYEDRIYQQRYKKGVEGTLQSHDYVLYSKELVDEYCKAFDAIFNGVGYEHPKPDDSRFFY